MNSERTAIPIFKQRHDTREFSATESTELRERVADARAVVSAVGTWVLESRVGGDGSMQRTPLHPVPFRIGRAAGLELVLPSTHVSKTHAEIYTDGLTLRVRDLGSRNGTFLNRETVTDSPLHDGDVLHVGDYEFRVAREFVIEDDCPDAEGTIVQTAPLSRHFVSGATKVRQLIDEGAVTMYFQPVVTLPGAKLAACEALGRGRHPDLPESPVELFDLAGALGPDFQAALSRLFRRKAVELVKDLPEPPLVFVNTHPIELERPPGLLESLEELRSYAPHVDLVLEIHESALADTDLITRLRTRLMEINVGLAYDDFGAGQARLFELAEAPPHYLKFDRRFVTGLETAPVTRQRLVASLVAAARELLVKTIAEGVENAGEAAACVRAGFSHAQGYHYARPMPIEKLGQAS